MFRRILSILAIIVIVAACALALIGASPYHAYVTWMAVTKRGWYIPAFILVNACLTLTGYLVLQFLAYLARLGQRQQSTTTQDQV